MSPQVGPSVGQRFPDRGSGLTFLVRNIMAYSSGRRALQTVIFSDQNQQPHDIGILLIP